MNKKKLCGKCKINKKLDNFYKNRCQKDGLCNWCKACCSLYYKEYARSNKEVKKYQENYRKDNRPALKRKQAEYRKNNREVIRIRKLKYRFGISYKEAEILYMKKLRGVCAICGRSERAKNLSLSVDHDHNSGKIRGLLCGNCNKGLGCFKDNEQTLVKAIKYLRKHNGR